MKTESPIKVLGSKTYLWDRRRRWVGKKAKKTFLSGQNCRMKMPIFRLFWKFAKLAILMAIFSMKTAPTEKTEYTTTKATEIATSDHCINQMFVTTEDGMKYTETWSSNNTCILPPKSRDLATWPPPPTRTPHTLWFISRAQDYTEEHVLHLKGEL